jgi:D-glycero-D-manno-heptose 1,7-bisphosphate phosphatase
MLSAVGNKGENMLIILDKDDTLVQSVSGAKFVQEPTDQKLMPGVAERIAELRAMDGAVLVIASNQGGVAAGHKSLQDTIAEMRYCLDLLPQVDTAFFSHTYEGNDFYAVGPEGSKNHTHLGIGDYLASRPTLDDYSGIELVALRDTGFFRKPNPGMLLFAIKFFTAENSIMIGDRPEDEKAAAAAGIPFIDAQAWRTGAVKILSTGIIA